MEGVSKPLIQHSVSGSGFPATFVVHRQIDKFLKESPWGSHKVSGGFPGVHRTYTDTEENAKNQKNKNRNRTKGYGKRPGISIFPISHPKSAI